MKDFNKLQELLEANEQWPIDYNFKFIVKTDQLAPLLARLESYKTSSRESKNGTYISVTAVKSMSSASEIIAVYQSLSDIEGIISL